YVVYLAASATGGSRSLLGNVTVGANSFDISADFPLENYTHVLVYTRSDFGESSIPEAVPVVDVFSRVTDLDFVDKDLDAEQLGGFVRWIAPADASQVRASGRCRPNPSKLGVVGVAVLPASRKRFSHSG
ncbi:unnamed protein product, partial [Symbiodinium necroappetens]